MTFRKLVALFTVLSLLMALSVASVAAQNPEEEGIVEPLEAPLEPVAGQDVETEEVIDSEGNVVEDIEEGLIEVELAEPISPADAETEGIEEPAELEAPVEVSEEEETIVTADVVEGSAAIDKAYSTNVNYVNLGSSQANVTANYLLSQDEGSGTWPNVPSTGDSTQNYLSFTVDPASSVQHRHYGTIGGVMNTGSGSVAVSSNQPLGAVVQVRTPPGVSPGTFASYVGASGTSGSSIVLVPQFFNGAPSADGTADSQLAIQNVGSSATDVTVEFFAVGSTSADATVTITNLGVGVSKYLNSVSLTQLPDSLTISSVRVDAGSGSVVVVANTFVGDNSLQAYSGFASTEADTNWAVPLFASNRTTGAGIFNTPVNVQNVSGSSIAAGGITLSCTDGTTNVTASNPNAIADNAGYSFNPVADPTDIYPDGFIGSCTLTSSGSLVVYNQQRINNNGDTSNSAALRAFNSSDASTTLTFPIISRSLSNGFSSSVVLQNISGSSAAVTLDYNFNPDEVDSSLLTSPQNYDLNYNIANDSSLEQNHRTGTDGGIGTLDMPRGWFGALTVTSDQPIIGYVQFTQTTNPAGDSTQAVAALK